MPQIGPQSVVSAPEKRSAKLAGLRIIREDNYLIAKK